MNPYIKILRLSVGILSVIGLIVGGIVSGGIFLYWQFIVAAVAAFLITGAGNVINDIFDHAIDKVNAPHRPIPSGKISLNNAKRYYVIIAIIGLFLAALVSIWFFAIALLNFVILHVYSWKLKKIAVIGNVAVSWLAASTFLAAGLIDIKLFVPSLIILSIISFVGTFAREIIKDIEDVEGDRKFGAKTLPIRIGGPTAMIIASLLLLIACASLVYPYFIGVFSFWYLAFAIIPIALCFYAMVQSPKRSQKIVKIVMLLVMIAFIIGALVK